MGLLKSISNFLNPRTYRRGDFLGGFGDVTSKYITIDNDIDMLNAYQIVPTIQAIVNKTSDVFSKTQIKEFDKKGEELFDTPTLNLFANPHPFYSENEFLKTLSKEFQLYQQIFIYVNRKNLNGLISDGDTMLILPTTDVTVKYRKTNLKEIKSTADFISHYEFEFNNDTVTFEPYEIIHIADTSLTSDFITIDSFYKALEAPANTIMSAYNVRNNLQSKNGGYGILTNEGSGSPLEGDFGLDPDEVKKVQKDFKKYSFSRKDYQNIITSMRLKWQPMTYEISSMALPESVANAKTDICDLLNFPILSLNSLDGSTFSNMEISDKKLYTDAIIPLWELFEKVFNSQTFSLNEIKFDFSHIEALQKDRKVEIEISTLNDNQQIIRYEKGFITKNQCLIAMGLEEVPGGNNYFTQPKITEDEN